jgi:methyl-accepting chemotaxis protein
MDDVTQQNAALVEQAAAAAESMEEQARNLAQAVAIFKLTGIAAGGAPQALERSGNPANVARSAKRGKAA